MPLYLVALPYLATFASRYTNQPFPKVSSTLQIPPTSGFSGSTTSRSSHPTTTQTRAKADPQDSRLPTTHSLRPRRLKTWTYSSQTHRALQLHITTLSSTASNSAAAVDVFTTQRFKNSFSAMCSRCVLSALRTLDICWMCWHLGVHRMQVSRLVGID